MHFSARWAHRSPGPARIERAQSGAASGRPAASTPSSRATVAAPSGRSSGGVAGIGTVLAVGIGSASRPRDTERGGFVLDEVDDRPIELLTVRVGHPGGRVAGGGERLGHRRRGAADPAGVGDDDDGVGPRHGCRGRGRRRARGRCRGGRSDGRRRRGDGRRACGEGLVRSGAGLGDRLQDQEPGDDGDGGDRQHRDRGDRRDGCRRGGVAAAERGAPPLGVEVSVTGAP